MTNRVAPSGAAARREEALTHFARDFRLLGARPDKLHVGSIFMAIEIAGLKSPFPPDNFPARKIQAGEIFELYGGSEIDIEFQ